MISPQAAAIDREPQITWAGLFSSPSPPTIPPKQALLHITRGTITRIAWSHVYTYIRKQFHRGVSYRIKEGALELSLYPLSPLWLTPFSSSPSPVTRDETKASPAGSVSRPFSGIFTREIRCQSKTTTTKECGYRGMHATLPHIIQVCRWGWKARGCGPGTPEQRGQSAVFVFGYCMKSCIGHGYE